MKISNAANIPLNQQMGSVPNMSDTLTDYFQTMTFTKLTKTITGSFEVSETSNSLSFQGVWEPFTPRQLMMKPEGQRSWQWSTVYAGTSLALIPDEIISYLGKSYRVMSATDYSLYGYMTYELVQDYSGTGVP
jgi:hypothetical protein